MMCERAGEVTAQTSSKYLPLGAIFRAYSKVRGYLLYPSKQLYNPQHTPVAHSLCHHCNTGGTTPNRARSSFNRAVLIIAVQDNRYRTHVIALGRRSIEHDSQ